MRAPHHSQTAGAWTVNFTLIMDLSLAANHTHIILWLHASAWVASQQAWRNQAATGQISWSSLQHTSEKMQFLRLKVHWLKKNAWANWACCYLGAIGPNFVWAMAPRLMCLYCLVHLLQRFQDHQSFSVAATLIPVRTAYVTWMPLAAHSPSSETCSELTTKIFLTLYDNSY